MRLGQAGHHAFSPEEIGKLMEAFRCALLDIRGRPAWWRKLGKERMTEIAARAIITSATCGVLEQSELQAYALRAVKVEYLRNIN